MFNRIGPISLVLSIGLFFWGCNSGSNPISVRYALTITSTNGSVAKNPDKTYYNPGDTVTLTATPSNGYTFYGWSGDASGAHATTTVIMLCNRNVVANFVPAITVTYLLTITATNGMVTKVPDKTTFTAGETVALTAHPNSGYAFTGWSGDTTGNSSTIVLTMNGNKNIIASFQAMEIGTWAGATTIDTLGATITIFMKLALNANQTFKDSMSVRDVVPGMMDTTMVLTSQGTWKDIGNYEIETTNTACTENGLPVACSSAKDTIDISGINGNTWAMTDQGMTLILTKQ